MKSFNPNKFRDEGRVAFDPSALIGDLNPYKKAEFWNQKYSDQWIDGWKEAEKIYLTESACMEMDFSALEKRVVEKIFVYLGDGVYVKTDQFGVWLHANDHLNPTDKIYLEWSIFEALKLIIGNR